MVADGGVCAGEERGYMHGRGGPPEEVNLNRSKSTENLEQGEGVCEARGWYWEDEVTCAGCRMLQDAGCCGNQ